MGQSMASFPGVASLSNAQTSRLEPAQSQPGTSALSTGGGAGGLQVGYGSPSVKLFRHVYAGSQTPPTYDGELYGLHTTFNPTTGSDGAFA